MSVDPREAQVEAFLKKPRREQLDILIKTYTRGMPGPEPPWLSEPAAQALMMQMLIESSYRLEGLTRWLVRLTVALFLLTIVLAGLTGYAIARRLSGN